MTKSERKRHSKKERKILKDKKLESVCVCMCERGREREREIVVEREC